MPPSATPDVPTLLALWEREREAEVARFREASAAMTLKERLARGLACAGLEVVDTLPAAGGRLTVLVRSNRRDVAFDRHHVRLRPGDPVVLCRTEPDEEGAVRAIVGRWQGELLGLAVDAEAVEALEEAPFRLEREAPATTFLRGREALEALRRPAGDLARLWAFATGALTPRVEGRAPATWFDEDLDGPQREAIANALEVGPISLIHGPPGTGKTRALVESVRQLVANGHRVLVAAPSNTAVDNLAERLVAVDVEVLRIGHPARVSPALEAVTLDARLDATEAAALAAGWLREAQALRARTEKQAARGTGDREARRDAFREARRMVGDARDLLRRTEAALVERARVVCVTLTLASHPALRGLRFDVVVVDEATQAVDPLLWIALGRAPRAILAGDPCQLPPTLVDPEVARSALGESLFERLHRLHGDALLRMLRTQHRMHADIMAFPSEAMYGGRLVAHPRVAGHRLEDLPEVDADPARDAPLVLIDAAGAGWHDARREPDGSTLNPAFAERTAREVRRLASRGVPVQDIGVITAYDAQVGLLRGQLSDLVTAGLDVSSIDGFQGREREAIVLDLVRSNDDSDLGFLTDTRRINVALTRARRLLIVVADSATLGGHPFYQRMLESFEILGCWVSVFADDGTL
jgi:ATP-dependent RNA/DNA helicase IGHMBP2